MAHMAAWSFSAYWYHLGARVGFGGVTTRRFGFRVSGFGLGPWVSVRTVRTAHLERRGHGRPPPLPPPRPPSPFALISAYSL